MSLLAGANKCTAFVFCSQVQSMDYSCIVFDTAPTGHTLRLLQFPSTLEKGLAKLVSLRDQYGGMITQVRERALVFC